MANTPVGVAILGAGQRSGYLYGPLIKALPQEVTLLAAARHQSALAGGRPVTLPFDPAEQTV